MSERDDTKRTFLYLGSGDWERTKPGTIVVYEVDRATRQLTMVSEHDAGGLAAYLTIDSQRRWLFSADENDGGVLAYTIDPNTGSLRPNGGAASDRHPVHLSLTPDDRYLLGANYVEGSVDVYPVDAAGRVGASIQTVPTGDNAHCVVMEGDGRVLVANKGSDTISRFTCSGGMLTPQTPPTTASPSPRHIMVGPDGVVYVVSEEHDALTMYAVSPDGGLVEQWQGRRLPDGGAAKRDTGADVRITPDGAFVYATNRGESCTLVAYDTGPDTPSLVAHTPTGGTIPRSLAMDPRGEFLVVGNRGDNKLGVFDIGADGALAHVATMDTQASPYFVTLVDL